MALRPSRRDLLIGAAAGVGGGWALAADRLGAIEARTGGRLGVAALDMPSGRRLAHRAGERFPMCSTFKVLAVSALLAKVDRGGEHLDRFVAYGPADLLPYAPIARAHVGEGGMRLSALCAAAIEHSDNTAANLILARIGGPAGWTGFARAIGDPISRLDRTEPALNSAEPGDDRDTTAPQAMLADLRAVAAGGVLSPDSRARLVGWMVDCQTGQSRLRAGLPHGWRVGDKTGTGDGGTANDMAIAFAPGGPILITSYLSGAVRASDDERDAAHAEVARIVVDAFRPEAGRG
ncbi:MAG TPA: class A beta-lactamase [Caulobacteraceae bacterium]|nr:class A beta-lactamase [Caulobacteraceae bacterium]